MTDPTNARLRDFDIPVIMPRIDSADLPPFGDAVTTADLTAPAAQPDHLGGP
jgi:hypothetical protein